ncbi:AI-2E family transporter [Anaerotalea alkaliphila]|uniref:AI-2E family transporter n=1 Tax=Anaerotalea alkaliphila TaxID=2662126 RepID=A0A7X5KP88_9FIRM|nr:AI-2E family transporter [Anaerotalea alkaliphila]NDL67712.1 AI-2E family transporter [Anaerotalea alkaliphila]
MRLDWNRKYTTIAAYAVIVFAVCYGIYKFTDNWENTLVGVKSVAGVLYPFLMAFLLAYFISPMVNFFERKLFSRLRIGKFHLPHKGLQRGLSIFLAYVVILGFVVILLAFVLPQLLLSIREVADFPQRFLPIIMAHMEEGKYWIGDTDYYLDLSLFSDYINSYLPDSLEQLSEMLKSFAPTLVTSITRLAAGLLNLVLGLIIAIYILFAKERSVLAAKKGVLAVFSPELAIYLMNVFKDSHRIFTNFFIGKLLDSLLIGILTFFVLLFAGIPYTLLLSVLVGVTNIIPYFGPFIGGGVGFFLLLVLDPARALWFLLIVLVIQQFDANILGPKILGDSTGLSPFWVIFSIIIFGKIFGFIGMFLGVPFFAVISTVVQKSINAKYDRRMSSVLPVEEKRKP